MNLQDVSYIVEGQDCTGKSTIIEVLRQWLLSRGYSTCYHHFMYPKGNTPEAKYAYQHGQFQLMFDMIRSSVRSARWVFDRAHIGEYVWGPKLRDKWPTYMYDLERSNKDLPIVLILVDCVPSIVLSRFRNRPNENPPKLTDIEELRHLFKTFCTMSPFQTYSINTTDLEISDYKGAIERLVEFVETS